MIIRQLELKNFLSHDHSLINFDKGVTVIYGHNGAGKSSIIDAVKFALFGEKRGSQISDLIRRGSEDLEVSLDFEIGPDQYSITRMMSMGKSGIKSRDAILKKNKSELARTVSSVDDTVTGILGIDKDTFLNSVFVEQGEIDTLISKTRAERENTFSRILGLNLLKEYADELGKLSRDTEGRLQSFSNVTENIDQMEASISGKEEEIRRINSEIASVSSEKSSISESLTKAEEEKNRIQASMAGLKAISNTADSRKKAMEQIQIRVDRRTLDIKNLRDKLEALSREVDSDLLSKADAIGDYFTLSDTLPAKKELLKDLTSRVEQIEKMATEIKSLEQGHRAYTLFENKLNELRSKRPELEQKETKYRSEQNRIREIQVELDRRRNTLNTISTRLKGQFEISEITPETIQKLKDDLEVQKNDVDTKIQEIRSSVGKINSDLKEINDNKTLLSSSAKCPLCLQDLTEEHRARIDREYSTKEETFRKSLNDFAAAKKKLDEKKVFIEGRIGSLNSVDVNNSLVEAKFINNLEEEKKNVEASVLSLKQDHEAFSKYQEEVIDIEKKMKTLRYSYDKYRSYEMTLSSSNQEDLRRRLDETSKDISEAETKLQEMEKQIDIKPDPNMRQRLRDMREKEKTHTNVKQSLFALNTTQKSENDQIETMKREIRDLEGQLSGLAEYEKKYAEATSAYEEINRRLHDTISRESSLKTRIETEEKSIQDLKSAIEKLKGDLQALENIKGSIATINRLRACFDRDGIQKAIRKDSAVYITNKVREYSSSFNLDFDDVNINEEMAIEVSQNGNVESIDMLSGGEKVALAIALRLSLATYVMESIKTIVMDEPTTYLDEDRRNNLKDIIQYTFKGDETPVPQMVIVTHHKELGSVADNVFEISKKGGVSQVIQG